MLCVYVLMVFYLNLTIAKRAKARAKYSFVLGEQLVVAAFHGLEHVCSPWIDESKGAEYKAMSVSSACRCHSIFFCIVLSL
jgi:hypothetical protein